MTGREEPIRPRRNRTVVDADDKLRHDNPHWPVRSPTDAANALLLHEDCPWHCSTRVAAIIVSRNDYQYFRDRDPGRAGGETWTPRSGW